LPSIPFPSHSLRLNEEVFKGETVDHLTQMLESHEEELKAQASIRIHQRRFIEISILPGWGMLPAERGAIHKGCGNNRTCP
jgi:hypothetical protein